MKSIILFALLVVVDKLVGFTFVKMKDYGLKTNPESDCLKTPYVVEKVDADVLIIGSSRAAHHYVSSLISDSLRLTTYNCGQDGCFFLYQNCIINMMLDRYNPKQVIWDVQPQYFNILANESKEYQNVRYLSPYYNSNAWAKNFINSQEKMTSIKMKSQMFAYNSKLLHSVFPIVTSDIKTEDGYLLIPTEGYAYPNLDSNNIDTVQYFGNQEKLNLFSATVARCKSEGVELLVLVSPQYSYRSNAFLNAIADLQKVAEKSGCEVYDYSDLYLDDPTKFKDASHMNHKGAVAFTKMVIEEHLRGER